MNRWMMAALPVGAAALIGAALFVPTAAEDRPAPRAVPIEQTTYACPTGKAFSVAAGQVSAGTTRTARLSGGDDASALDDGARWETNSFDAAGVIVGQAGKQLGAAGFFAGESGKDAGGGLVVGACSGPIDQAWFAGAGSADGHQSTVVLSNLSATPAVADVRLWGTKGPIEAIDASGITLDPYEVRRLDVADLAAGEPAVAIQVQRTRGSMAAMVDDRFESEGTEPLGSTLSPRRDQIVGGVDGETDGRTLQVLNSGGRTARVDVEVIAESGTVAAEGLQGLKVQPGQLSEIEVPESVGKGAQAYRLTSDQPVAASVRVRASADDYSVAEATEPLDGAALVPVDLDEVDVVPDLVLTAPKTSASVRVETFDAAMKSLGSRVLTVKAGTTDRERAFDPDADFADDVAYVQVTGAGDVIAAAQYDDGDLASSLALSAVPLTVEAPAVRRGD